MGGGEEICPKFEQGGYFGEFLLPFYFLASTKERISALV